MARADLSELEKKLKKLLRDFESPQIMTETAEFARDMVVLRTRLGRGLDGPLKKLSESYRKVRAGKLAFFSKGTGPSRVTVPYKPTKAPVLHPQTSPGKSNLTFTGKMLNSIKVVSVKRGSAVIAPTGSRGTDTNLSNEDVAEFVSEERPFLGLTAVEIKRLQKYFADKLQRLIGRT